MSLHLPILPDTSLALTYPCVWKGPKGSSETCVAKYNPKHRPPHWLLGSGSWGCEEEKRVGVRRQRHTILAASRRGNRQQTQLPFPFWLHTSWYHSSWPVAAPPCPWLLFFQGWRLDAIFVWLSRSWVFLMRKVTPKALTRPGLLVQMIVFQWYYLCVL